MSVHYDSSANGSTQKTLDSADADTGFYDDHSLTLQTLQVQYFCSVVPVTELKDFKYSQVSNFVCSNVCMI